MTNCWIYNFWWCTLVIIDLLSTIFCSLPMDIPECSSNQGHFWFDTQVTEMFTKVINSATKRCKEPQRIYVTFENQIGLDHPMPWYSKAMAILESATIMSLKGGIPQGVILFPCICMTFHLLQIDTIHLSALQNSIMETHPLMNYDLPEQ